MDRSEIVDILTRCNVFTLDENGEVDASQDYDIDRLIEDPIVTNRIAVEALQMLPRGFRFDAVLAANKASELFAFSLAIAAWARFTACDEDVPGVLKYGSRFKKDETVMVVDIVVDESSSIENAIDVIDFYHAKSAGLISLIASEQARPISENFYPVLVVS